MKNNMEFSSDDQFSTTKYIIKINYTIKGHVDVMDIIGALFGQTEGLLNDLELRELQKTGRIGRIQVQNKTVKGDSVGEILIPSSLDRVETAILAATIESVDRVGPCTAQMQLAEIQDIREDKRKKIMDRATELLQKLNLNTPEADELGESILDKMRTGELVEYGPEKLPAGQDIDTNPQIIIVEGVADVRTLMKSGFRNGIGTNGTHVPQSIIDLSKKKSCIAFVDGDRGGEMILNELLQVADIDYIAFAPKGLMVEELQRKEIIKRLQAKIPLQEYLAEKEAENKEKNAPKPAIQQEFIPKKSSSNNNNFQGRPDPRKRTVGQRNPRQPKTKQRSGFNNPRGDKRNGPPMNNTPPQNRPAANVAPVDSKIVDQMKSILASNEAIGLSESNDQIFRVGNTKVFNTLDSAESVKTLVLDGVVTQRLLDKALEKNINTIFAINHAKNLDVPSDKKIELLLFKDYIQ